MTIFGPVPSSFKRNIYDSTKFNKKIGRAKKLLIFCFQVLYYYWGEAKMRKDNDDKQNKTQNQSIYLASQLRGEIPQITGLKTGVEGLDNLFFVTYLDKKGKPQIKPIGGFPSFGIINITGIPDTGKSLMAEQFALTQASLGHPVCFVTVEQPAVFAVAGLRNRAASMGLDFEAIEERLVIIDASTNPVLREDLSSLLDTLAYAIKSYKTRVTIIDSITGLYEAREMMARMIVRALFTFLKKWRQTALFISQKRSGHEELTAEAAGGYAVGHILDGTIVLFKKEIMSRYDQSLYGKEIGDLIRLLRIDGCRLCGHDPRVYVVEILENGIIKIKEPLETYLRKLKKEGKGGQNIE
jgi:KaiC domain protein